MAVNTPREIVDSYIGLLIMQYLNKPKATAQINAFLSPTIIPQVSVQSIALSAVPTSGTFVLTYQSVNTAAINWNDSAATIQTKLRSLTALAAVVVTGSLASQSLVVTFTGVTPPAYALSVASNGLLASVTAVTLTIAETDVTIPLAVQGAFNLVPGTTIAAGVQLDVLGKYAGVTRTGQGFTQQITLDDANFLTLIYMAITKNSSGSSLATIQNFMHQFFPGEILVFDNRDMSLTYVISSTLVSRDLIELFITEGLLPSPMGVRTNEIYYVPSTRLFSFRTYDRPNTLGSPFNTYANFQPTPWLSYANIIGS